MRIGFYAPLKAPDHPVPSGDRQMARALIAAMTHAGHEVELYSRLRTYAAAPDSPPLPALREAAAAEADRVSTLWETGTREPPDLLFTYHLYYKAPDLLGPALSQRFGRPYVTAEATLSRRRAEGAWADRQGVVEQAVRRAVANICFTRRDRDGLADLVPEAMLADLPPFIDGRGLAPPARPPQEGAVRLVTVAMMRPGDKLDSYRFLGAALAKLVPLAWRLTVIGDGPARDAVRDALAPLPADRLLFPGEMDGEGIARALGEADVMVWPGFGEAFGLCYLEAQACGVPVVAVRNAGTPSVIEDGETGLLTAPDPTAFAGAIERLIADRALRERMGRAAQRFVHGSRSLPVASTTLDAILRAAAARA